LSSRIDNLVIEGGGTGSVEVLDTLDSTSTIAALSANKGRELKETIDGFGEASTKDVTDVISENSQELITSGAVYTAVSNLENINSNIVDAFSTLGMSEESKTDGYEIALVKSTNTAEKTKVKVPVFDAQNMAKNPVGLVSESFVDAMGTMMDGKIETALEGFSPEGEGSNVTIVQETGASTTDVMSQKAVTDAINNEKERAERIEGNLSDSIGSLGTTVSSIGNELIKEKARAEEAEKGLSDRIDNLVAGGGGESTEVIDNLNSTSTTAALSANQGRVLSEKIGNWSANDYGNTITENLSTINKALEDSAPDEVPTEGSTSTVMSGGVYQAIEETEGLIPVPDEEDVTKTEDGKLKFADRGNTTGMGYVILRKDKTFAEQVNKENTIYEIRYDFVIEGSVTIPSGCILRFNGGSLSDGAITSDGTIFELQLHCLRNISLLEKNGQVNYNPIDVDSALLQYALRGFMTWNIVEDITVSMSDIVMHNNAENKCKLTINGNGHKITFANDGLTRQICDVVELKNVHIYAETEGKQYYWYATGLRDRYNCEVYADNCIFENLYIGGTYKSLKYNACKFINCWQIYGHNAEDADMNGELSIDSSTFVLGSINQDNKAAIQISYFGKLGSATITGCKFIDESEDRRSTDWVDCYSTQNLIITGCTFQSYNVGSGEAVFVNIKGHSEAATSGQSSWLDTIGDTFNYIVSNNIFNIERKKAEYVNIPSLITIQNYPRLESVAGEEFNSKRNAQIVNNIVRIAGEFPYPQTNSNNGDAKAVTVFSIADGFNELIISGNTVFGNVPFKEIVVDESTGETFSLFERIIFIETSRYNGPIYKQRVENMVVKNNAIFAKSMAVMLIPSMIYYSNLTDEEKKEALKPVRNVFENNYVLSASYRTNFNLSTIPTAFADESNKFKGNIYISDSDGYTIGTASKQFNTLNRQDKDSSIVHAVGDCLFSDGKPKWWSGSKWVDATGAAV